MAPDPRVFRLALWQSPRSPRSLPRARPGGALMGIEVAFPGSLVRDAEAKTSKAGKQYLRINVRVENGDKAEFINAMVFDPDAIAVADKLVKGARVYIEGKLSLDEWTAQDGTKRTGLS